ncbi:MAG: alpha/beta hydrolase [Spirulina sp.]
MLTLASTWPFAMSLFKLFLSGLGVASLGYLALCGWLWLIQRRMMYLPTPLGATTPADWGIPYQEVWIPVQGQGEGGQLHGWWMPTGDHPELTVLYLHGNSGNISNNIGPVQRLHALGISVLTFDYRGYGRSSGPFPSEHRLYEDAFAAYQFLIHEKDVSPHHLIAYGHSLGGAIAIDLAHRCPDLAGLVVEGSFTSMGDMAARSAYNPWFPVRRILTQQFESLAKVPYLALPTLYIHGLADSSVPATMGQILYQATPAPKDLWLVPNADHNDLIPQTGADFDRHLRQFIQHHILTIQTQP